MKKKNNAARLTAIIAVFGVACLVFTLRLLGFQLSGGDSVLSRNYDMKTYTYNVTVPGLRGDICDRNGLVIATTKDTYSMHFEYWYFFMNKKVFSFIGLCGKKQKEITKAIKRAQILGKSIQNTELC